MTPVADRPRIVLVTRHPGALAWLRETLDAPDARHVEHLGDVESLQPGDTVAGNLPLHLMDRLCARGITVLGLDLSQSLAQRGQAVDAQAMRQAGATLTRYEVRAMPCVPAGRP